MLVFFCTSPLIFEFYKTNQYYFCVQWPTIIFFSRFIARCVVVLNAAGKLLKKSNESLKIINRKRKSRFALSSCTMKTPKKCSLANAMGVQRPFVAITPTSQCSVPLSASLTF